MNEPNRSCFDSVCLCANHIFRNANSSSSHEYHFRVYEINSICDPNGHSTEVHHVCLCVYVVLSDEWSCLFIGWQGHGFDDKAFSPNFESNLPENSIHLPSSLSIQFIAHSLSLSLSRPIITQCLIFTLDIPRNQMHTVCGIEYFTHIYSFTNNCNICALGTSVSAFYSSCA